MTKTNLKQLRNALLSGLMLAGAYAVISVLSANDAMAQTSPVTSAGTIGGAIDQMKGNISGAANLVYVASYIGGTVALMMGAFKLKQHTENPSQTPIAHGLGRLAVGAGLIALPSVGGSILNSTGITTSESAVKSQAGNIDLGTSN